MSFAYVVGGGAGWEERIIVAAHTMDSYYY